MKDRGISFFSLLTLLFIGLKLGKCIDWDWVWILCPIWIPVVFVIVLFIVLFWFFVFVELVKWIGRVLERSSKRSKYGS